MQRGDKMIVMLHNTPELWELLLALTKMGGVAIPTSTLLSDADLASLAVSGERYRRNSENIRTEFAHIPETVFRSGRAAIIAALLAAPTLYRTPGARKRWEQQARENLRAELDTLT